MICYGMIVTKHLNSQLFQNFTFTNDCHKKRVKCHVMNMCSHRFVCLFCLPGKSFGFCMSQNLYLYSISLYSEWHLPKVPVSTASMPDTKTIDHDHTLTTSSKFIHPPKHHQWSTTQFSTFLVDYTTLPS
jgi:hypothetical protein